MRNTTESPVGRILMMIGSLSRGGTEQQLVAVAAGLRRRGWDVNVFSLAAGPLLRELETAGVPSIVPVGKRKAEGKRNSWPYRLTMLAAAAVQFVSALLRLRPAVVHFFLPEAYLLGGPLALASGRRVHVMSRRSLNHYQRAYPRFVALLEHWLHRHMTVVLGNSRRVLSELRQDERVDPCKLGLIYNGVDLARFSAPRREAARNKLGLDTETLALIMVANLIAYKGHRDLLHALAMAKEKLPAHWRLLLVGRDDGIKRDLEAEAVRHGFASQIVFMGERADVPHILSAGDIGLLCSHEEGFSNAVLEGMAAGLPMIVTDVGGNAEAVIDGESGLVVPPHNPAALADAIVRLADDVSLRQRLGTAARVRVEAEFSLEACVAHHDALYRGLLDGRKPHEILEIQIDNFERPESLIFGSRLERSFVKSYRQCAESRG